ncbi:MAG: protein kinase domain-containing protein [Chthoniobacterales bacterium]
MKEETTVTFGLDWAEWKEIVGEALEQENAAARTAFLQRACGGDTPLFRRTARLLNQSTEVFEEFADLATARLRQEPLSLAGRQLGAYQIDEELGRGGMGTVYLAQRPDGQFTRKVAIKILKDGVETDEILRRFQVEREILARLEHPNITRLLDAGTTDTGSPYFIMEFVEGALITDFARQEDLSSDDAIGMFLKVCRAVAFAHHHGVVHRDIKPRNILVRRDSEPKLLDFGIAKVMCEQEDELTITQPAHRRLTPKYAAPEQIAGQRADRRSDIYSLGAVLLELLTRKPGPLRADLSRVVTRAMAADPARRYQSAAEFADDLARCTTVGVRRRRRTKRLLLGAAIAITLAAAVVITRREMVGRRPNHGIATTNPAASDAYTMGLHFWSKRTSPALDSAIDYLHRATAADPQFARAYALLADCYYLKAFLRYAPAREALRESRRASELAIALDPTAAEPHVSLANVQFLDGEETAGMKSLQRALGLNPNLAIAHQRYAWALCSAGKLDEALPEMKRATELDPLSATNHSALGAVLIFARQYPAALDSCYRAVELEPGSALSQLNLGWAYHLLGRCDEAIAAYRKVGELDETRTGDATALIAAVLYSAGRIEEADKLMKRLNEFIAQWKIDPYNLVLLNLAHGDMDGAFNRLTETVRREDSSDIMLRLDPLLEPLRRDPRFRKILDDVAVRPPRNFR